MLNIQCGACAASRPIDQVHAWVHGAGVCCAGCAVAREASQANKSPVDQRARALSILAQARRANAEVAAADALWLDRAEAANAIIGLTKSARSRKRSLEREAEKFEALTEPARKSLENALARLMGALMALAGEIPAVVEVAVRLARVYPNNAGEADGDLATIEGLLTGASRPPSLAIDRIADGSRCAERHRDGVCTYELERFKARDGGVWVAKNFTSWPSFAVVECVDGVISVKSVHGAVLAHVAGEDKDRLFAWAREERPDLRESERTMTGVEAVLTPAVLLVLVLVIGFGIAGVLHFVGASSFWLGAVGVVTALLGTWSITSAVRRLVRRPLVRQLVAETAPVSAASEAQLSPAM